MLTTTGRSRLLIAFASTLVLPFAVSGCTRTPAQAAPPSSSLAEEQRQALEAARQQLDLIPPPSKTRYMAVRSLTSWENPYVTVQGGMVTLHVLMADPNPSRFIEFWTYDHPAIGRRAAFAKAYDPWAAGMQPKYFKADSRQ